MPLLKSETQTPNAGRNRLSPRKMSKSAHFITYSIAERGHVERDLAPTLPVSPLCFLPLKQFNPTLLGYETTRQPLSKQVRIQGSVRPGGKLQEL